LFISFPPEKFAEHSNPLYKRFDALNVLSTWWECDFTVFSQMLQASAKHLPSFAKTSQSTGKLQKGANMP